MSNHSNVILTYYIQSNKNKQTKLKKILTNLKSNSCQTPIFAKLLVKTLTEIFLFIYYV